MSFKNNGTKRDAKKMFSALMCLLIALAFFLTLYTAGFSIFRLLLGFFCLYLSVAFFRTSNEY